MTLGENHGAGRGSGFLQVTWSTPSLADMDAERETLQSTACPEVQTFCQKHGLMFEVIPCLFLTVSVSPALELGYKGVSLG